MASRESNDADAEAFARLEHNPDYQRWIERLQGIIVTGERSAATRLMVTPQDIAEHNYQRGVTMTLRRLTLGPLKFLQPAMSEPKKTRVA